MGIFLQYAPDSLREGTWDELREPFGDRGAWTDVCDAPRGRLGALPDTGQGVVPVQIGRAPGGGVMGAPGFNCVRDRYNTPALPDRTIP